MDFRFVVSARFILGALCAGLYFVATANAQPTIPTPPSSRLPELPAAPIPKLAEEPTSPKLEVRTALQPVLQPPVSPNPSIPEIVPPQPKLAPEVLLPDGSNVILPEQTKQIIRFGPRYGKLNDYTIEPMGEDTQRLTYTGGLIVNVVYLPEKPGEPPQEIEFATDNSVIWIRGLKRGQNVFGGLETEREKTKVDEGQAKEDKVKVEFYMSGNVILRVRSGEAPGGLGAITQTLRADELYYDVDRNRAIALQADLETALQSESGYDPIHMKAREIWRLGVHEWRTFESTLFSSKRPADPALTLTSQDSTLVERNIIRRNIFGRPVRDLRTGETVMEYERVLTANRNRLRVEGVPLLFLPTYKTDITDPVGPLAGIGIRQDGIFGVQAYFTWDMFKLLGYRPRDGHRWTLNTDYMSTRGPALGTDYTYKDLFGLGLANTGNISGYIVRDAAKTDTLGAFRGPEPINPRTRGRFQWIHNQDIYENGTEYLRYFGQLAFQSDKNFQEQFYKFRFDSDMNPETFGYLYGARGIYSGSLLGQVNWNRPWVTETQWLPRVDGAVTGLSIFDRLVYSSRASAGYALLRPPTQAPLPPPPIAQPVDTIRLDWFQKVSAPLDVGPLRLEPYGLLDLSYYSRDLSGNSRGRYVGGGGAKASIPFSRLYRGVESELLNVRGLNHKMNLTANYYYTTSDTSLTQLPRLDRLNDETADLTARTFRSTAPFYAQFLPNLINTDSALALASDPVYDANLYALRRVATNRPETLDQLQVIQFDWNHRLQTKRGPVGNEHTTDWMTLDLSASLFPDSKRDNFGKAGFSFLEYNYGWNIGDRLALSATGWVDPFEFGARYFNTGITFNRPDGTSVFLGYRHIDPLGSRALITSLNYRMSPKYSLALNNILDFGFQKTYFTTVNFTRTGTDLSMMLGFTFNAIVNNFGIQFLLVPNAAAGFINQAQLGNQR